MEMEARAMPPESRQKLQAKIKDRGRGRKRVPRGGSGCGGQNRFGIPFWGR